MGLFGSVVIYITVADPEVQPLGVLDLIMRKMINNNNVIIILSMCLQLPLTACLLKLTQEYVAL